MLYYEKLRKAAAELKQIRESGSIPPESIIEHIAPVYIPVHDDIQAGTHQYINLIGGRGSGKSSFISLEIVSGIMNDPTGNSSAIIFRRTGNTLRESVYTQIAWAIDTLNAGALWKGTVNPLTYTYIPTGATILFRGLDDSSKIKSIKPRKGIFRYVWIEEFSELAGERFLRSVLQSVIRGNGQTTVFYSFNPPISKSNWANLYYQRPDDRMITLKTSYLDMPPEWIGDDFIYQAERLKEINPDAYEHEYLGNPIDAGGLVFPNIETRTITDDEINGFQYVYGGVDFGFSADPAIYIRVAYDRKHETVYFIDEIYKHRCSNRELAAAIKEKGYDQAARPEYLPISGYSTAARDRIICDCSEPKSIQDLRDQGIKAIACKKYPGSVEYGIKWLQHRKLIIDQARTPNAYREFINYEYERTKDGEYLASVPDKDNHLIDGTRYALDLLINSRKESA